MKSVPLFLIIVTLPLLLSGCGVEEPVAGTKPELEGVEDIELEFREDIAYLKGSNTPYTGKSYTVYLRGEKRTEENYKDGKKEGLHFKWYTNGEKQVEMNFNDGKENGLHTEWYRNGKKEGEGNYKNGKIDGLWAFWDIDGHKQSEVNYKDGEKHGLSTQWHKNGQKMSEETYKDGEYEKGSDKYWNSYGESVNSLFEAEKE